MVRHLCDAGALFSDCEEDKFENSGGAALMLAAQNGYWEEVRLLCDVGVDPASLTLDGMTALHYASEKGHIHVARVLLAGGALETPIGDTSSRPACGIGIELTTKNPPKNAWMRRLLARGPAFRARPWL